MLKYIIRRLLQGVGVLFVVTLLTFLALKVIPADPATLILGIDATPESVAQLREAMGLNRPLLVQYWEWITAVLQGDLGTSYYYGSAVSDLIRSRLPLTLTIALLTTFFSLIFGTFLGTLAALYRRRGLDYLIRLFTQLSGAVPSFWLGMIALTYLAARLQWFSVHPEIDLANRFWGSLYQLLLPTMVLTLTQMGPTIRQTRSAMYDALEADYMMSARMKGLSERRRIIRYALRSAMMAPLTLSSLQFAHLIGGTTVVETVFSLPGLGRLLLVSVEQRDLMLLQGLILFITTMVIVISVVTDILYQYINGNTEEGV